MIHAEDSTMASKRKKENDEKNLLSPAGYEYYRLIGKLTAFLQLQEFSQRNQPVSFPFAARLSFNSSKVKLVWLSLKQQSCV